MSKPRHSPESHLKFQHDRLMMSALDFRHALSAATFLLEEVEWEGGRFSKEEQRRFKCYETSMVVSYGPPFSSARCKSAPFCWRQLGGEFVWKVRHRVDEAMQHHPAPRDAS
ncbi:hypothetical protein [Novosphingobium mathurense]|uniref:hypothetical protein n=1 Tax=Novosphingobium mathurense TaxID=428990 RepID=UPI0009A86FCB|nr:hypothetical protein [Novosphingobium mathurense]